MSSTESLLIRLVSIVAILAFTHVVNHYGAKIAFLSIGGVLILLLLLRKSFWGIFFGFAAIASFIAMVASIIYFQIIGAVGFLLLSMLLGAIASGFLE